VDAREKARDPCLGWVCVLELCKETTLGRPAEEAGSFPLARGVSGGSGKRISPSDRPPSIYGDKVRFRCSEAYQNELPVTAIPCPRTTFSCKAVYWRAAQYNPSCPSRQELWGESPLCRHVAAIRPSLSLEALQHQCRVLAAEAEASGYRRPHRQRARQLAGDLHWYYRKRLGPELFRLQPGRLSMPPEVCASRPRGPPTSACSRRDAASSRDRQGCGGAKRHGFERNGR